MITKRFAMRAGMIGASAMMALSGLAGQANASSRTNIDYWSVDSAPVRCGTGSANWFCLYYSPGAEGAIWASRSSTWSDLSNATFSDDGFGSAGAGQGVRNNAASVENPMTYCQIDVFVYPGFVGDSNYLNPGKGGNLTSGLRNNEASVFACPAR